MAAEEKGSSRVRTSTRTLIQVDMDSRLGPVAGVFATVASVLLLLFLLAAAGPSPWLFAVALS